jgi:hypothetical protein
VHERRDAGEHEARDDHEKTPDVGALGTRV